MDLLNHAAEIAADQIPDAQQDEAASETEETVSAQETADDACCNCAQENAEGENGASDVCDECAEETDADEAAHGEGYFTIESEDGSPITDAPDAAPEKKKSPVLAIGLAVLIALAAVAAIFIAKAVKQNGSIVHENEAGYTSYTMTAEQATDRVLDRAVAVCGEDELTNRQLALYFWQEYYSFLNNYGQYAYYMIDTTMGLDEQVYDGDTTWQKQFLDVAVEMFNSVSSLRQEADANGFVLGESEQTYLDTLAENLDAAAVYYGFADGEAYLKQAFGSTVSVADYYRYVEDNMTASLYLEQLVSEAEVTDADIENYYDENAEDFEASRVLKDDHPMVTVRHILIQPTETDEEGAYTDDAWSEAEAQINDIFAEWEDGEQTEDAFSALATQYSVDGSASYGGLIENIYPGATVENFNDWCFDDARKVGDVAIVQTEYGYHIIYFSSVSDTVYWRETAKTQYLNVLSQRLADEIAAKYETSVDLESAAILDVLAEQAAASDTAAE